MTFAPKPAGPEQVTFQGKIIEIVEQPMQVGEEKITFEFARRAPGTRLIVPTEQDEILLTREFRPEIQGYDFRLPGGKVIDTLKEYKEFLSSGKDISVQAREAAIKEAREELGIEAKSIELFAISRAGATVQWDLYYFVVSEYTQGSQDLELGEDITVVPTSTEEVRAMCLDGRIQEDRSALMLLRFLGK